VEERKRNLDVRDEELVQIFFGAAKGAQASISKVEQSRIVDKPKVDSKLLSRVKEEEDDRSNRQEVKMSRKEFGDDFVDLSSSNFEMFLSMTPPTPPPPLIDIALFSNKNTSSPMLSREPEPLGRLIEYDEKRRRRLDQCYNRQRPQEHFSSSHRAQDPAIDEIMKEDQRFIEDLVKMQIRAIQEKQI